MAPSTTLPTSQVQPQPPSALKHESKAPGESQTKTVTFSEQLHQEVTFNPSNASSPFPINESVHPSFETISPSVSIKDTTQLDKQASSYYTSSSDITLTTCTPSITGGSSSISESIMPPSTTTTISTHGSTLLEAPPGALRRSSVTSISGQQQQQLQSQGQAVNSGQLSQQGQLLDQSSVLSEVKPGDESIITTGGLRDYEPDNVDGLSKARIRWLAAFNKVVAQMNEVSAK